MPRQRQIYEPEWAWKQAKEVHIYGLLANHLGDGVPLSEAEPPDWHAVCTQLGQLLARIHRIPQPLANNTAPALCHNDFHEGNVLVDPETWQVRGFIDVENAIAADPLMDLAKTECYSIRGNADKLAGLVDGYGELPVDWRSRTTLYRLYHSLELWDWFKSIGTVDPLDGIAGDLAEIV